MRGKVLHPEGLDSRAIRVPVLNGTCLQRKTSASCSVFIYRFYCILYVFTLVVVHYTYHTNLILDFSSLLVKNRPIYHVTNCVFVSILPKLWLVSSFKNVRILYNIFMTSCLQLLATIYIQSAGQQDHSLIVVFKIIKSYHTRWALSSLWLLKN